MQKSLKLLLAAGALAAAGHAGAAITLYGGENFHGQSFTADRDVWNLDRSGFNDRASSVIVDRGRWELCEHARFEGRCVVLRRGQYPSLAPFGLGNAVSSLRPVAGGRQVTEVAPPVVAQTYDYYPRHGEQLFTANVTSVRAVTTQAQQRCWVEREQVQRSDPNIPGALIGGVLGGVLGHQVGSGRGRDVATAVGAVGGAAVGANVGSGGSRVVTQDVQRCATVQGNVNPDYYDVTYAFRGREHRVQMGTPPGPTVTVNGAGEPRM
jgi:uncharacterized protein YcfJ